MATFTMTLKEALDRAPEKDIGLTTYPIFDETYRETLNQKIIDHYWNQEIGVETVSMFTFAMRRKMNEIMPFYNQHYELSAIKLEALSTADFHSTGTGTSQGTNDSTSGAKSRAVSSDTPQTALQADADYATAMQDNVSETTANGVSDTTETTNNAMTGYQGHQPSLILAARKTLINVDVMIIDELQELFMSVWANSDEFTEPQTGTWNYGYYW